MYLYVNMFKQIGICFGAVNPEAKFDISIVILFFTVAQKYVHALDCSTRAKTAVINNVMLCCHFSS